MGAEACPTGTALACLDCHPKTIFVDGVCKTQHHGLKMDPVGAHSQPQRMIVHEADQSGPVPEVLGPLQGTVYVSLERGPLLIVIST